MSRRPNILFIHTDSFDGRLLGCMGHPALAQATPNLDRLAAEGIAFANTYSNCPLCCPSRASTWSGRYAHRIDAWNNYRGLEPQSPTFASRLSEADYRTGIFGKTDYLSGSHSEKVRVASWSRAAAVARPVHGEKSAPRVLEEPVRRVREGDWKTAEAGISWLNEHAGEAEPFMLYLGLKLPHHGFVTSQRYLERIPPESVPVPPQDQLNHPLLPLQQLQKNWEHALDPDAMHLRRRIYFAMIAEVDEIVGEVCAALEASGCSDRTWIVFSSDHGEMAGEHRQYLKLTHFESSARVPLIVRGPTVSAGSRIERPVSLVDLHPTFLELAGLDVPPVCDGESLAGDIGLSSSRCEAAREGSSGRDWVFAEHHSTTCPTGSFMLRWGSLKYHAFVGYPPLLFNLSEDPDELRDLSRTHQDQCDVMDRKLREIVDYEDVDRRAKADDRERFVSWRSEALRAGTYNSRMAETYGGVSHGEAVPPWREEDEERIVRWLEGERVELPTIDEET